MVVLVTLDSSRSSACHPHCVKLSGCWGSRHLTCSPVSKAEKMEKGTPLLGILPKSLRHLVGSSTSYSLLCEQLLAVYMLSSPKDLFYNETIFTLNISDCSNCLQDNLTKTQDDPRVLLFLTLSFYSPHNLKLSLEHSILI